MRGKSLLLGILGLGGALATASAARRLTRRMSFRGRTIIISGGSRGLGLVIARQLAREGANLVLVARDLRELTRAQAQLAGTGPRVLTVPADITRPADIQHVVEETHRVFGAIDVLFNIAGLIQVGPLGHMSLEDFDRAMAVNYQGALNFIWAVLPTMRRRGGGRIVNVSSIGGEVPVPHMAPYVASKFALNGLSGALRAELEKENILVTTVTPSLMQTGSPGHAEVKGRHDAESTWFSVLAATPGLAIGAERAAARTIRACRYGVAQTTLTVQGRLISIFSRAFPNLFADVLGIVDRMLPGPNFASGDQARLASETRSPAGRNGRPGGYAFAARRVRAAAAQNNE